MPKNVLHSLERACSLHLDPINVLTLGPQHAKFGRPRTDRVWAIPAYSKGCKQLSNSSNMISMLTAYNSRPNSKSRTRETAWLLTKRRWLERKQCLPLHRRCILLCIRNKHKKKETRTVKGQSGAPAPKSPVAVTTSLPAGSGVWLVFLCHPTV